MSSDSANNGGRRAAAGLLVRRECWALSRAGKALVAALAGGMGLVTFFGVHPFLAVSEPIPAKILVIEGWVRAYALRAAIVEFRKGGYQEVITSGGVMDDDPSWPAGSTIAGWAAQRLARCGLAASLITPVPCSDPMRDRTYASALAVREWLEKNRPNVTAVDVLTVSTHARRSRLLYQQALGGKIRVGIISVPDADYDTRHWWRYSEGVRETIGEAIAYAYARFFFWPPATATDRAVHSDK